MTDYITESSQMPSFALSTVEYSDTDGLQAEIGKLTDKEFEGCHWKICISSIFDKLPAAKVVQYAGQTDGNSHILSNPVLPLRYFPLGFEVFALYYVYTR